MMNFRTTSHAKHQHPPTLLLVLLTLCTYTRPSNAPLARLTDPSPLPDSPE